MEIDGIEVHCCPAQAHLLLQFTRNSMILADLIACSPFSEQTTHTILNSMTACVEIQKNQVVLKTLSQPITLPSLISLPFHFTQSRYANTSVTLTSSSSHSHTLDEKERQTENEENLIDSSSRLSAWILSIVKKEKKISFRHLLKQVQVHDGTVSEREVRSVVDSLLDLEYVRRDGRNDQMILWE